MQTRAGASHQDEACHQQINRPPTPEHTPESSPPTHPEPTGYLWVRLGGVEASTTGGHTPPFLHEVAFCTTAARLKACPCSGRRRFKWTQRRGAATAERLKSAGAHLHRWRRLGHRAYRRPRRSHGRTPAYSSAGTGSPADCGGRAEHVTHGQPITRHRQDDSLPFRPADSDFQTHSTPPQVLHQLSHGAVETLIS